MDSAEEGAGVKEVFNPENAVALQNLRDFFSWAKKEGAHKIKVGEIEVEFVPDLGQGFDETKPPAVVDEDGNPVEPPEVSDEELYQSSG